MDVAAIQVELERLLDVCVDLPALEKPTLALWRCGGNCDPIPSLTICTFMTCAMRPLPGYLRRVWASWKWPA
ncbi:hypothetical protein THICB3620166 [Thiomonas sp. CB3]|nr:hypothetical protein THICB3620166 [Thiomonas sp. CB3]